MPTPVTGHQDPPAENSQKHPLLFAVQMYTCNALRWVVVLCMYMLGWLQCWHYIIPSSPGSARGSWRANSNASGGFIGPVLMLCLC